MLVARSTINVRDELASALPVLARGETIDAPRPTVTP
jgi:hypothetical protein